jgi:hypothetical protein
MNRNMETPQPDHSASNARVSCSPLNADELSRLKRELLQAEVRLAKARATVVGAEADIKIVSALLRALTR